MVLKHFDFEKMKSKQTIFRCQQQNLGGQKAKNELIFAFFRP
jgi:hypothetical protein